MTIRDVPTHHPMCSLCITRPVRSGGLSSDGYQRWRKHCASCDSAKYRKPRVVDLTCSICSFVAIDPCQIDSVDGKSVCACCNRLKVKQMKQSRHDEYELTVDTTVSASGDTRI